MVTGSRVAPPPTNLFLSTCLNDGCAGKEAAKEEIRPLSGSLSDAKKKWLERQGYLEWNGADLEGIIMAMANI